MATLRASTPEYWTSSPEFLAPIRAVCAEHGLRIAHHLLGSPDDEATPAAAVLEMPPGYVLARHAHPCERFEIIIKGSLQVGDEVLVAGDIMTAHAFEMYGPHIAGPEGCTTLEMFGALRGVGHTIFDTPDGPEEVAYR